jgi:hypothetical protein
MKTHVLIDVDENSYNVILKVGEGKLWAVWDKEPVEVNLEEVDIEIRERK